MTPNHVLELKQNQLYALANHREYLRSNPELRWLFFELTNAYNLFCAHCGSRCIRVGSELSIKDVEKALLSIPDNKPMICLTGGEPLLHSGFYRIANRIVDLGFYWGMTSNGVLIDKHTAYRLREAQMSTVSISLDGLENSHDRLRYTKGAWRKAVEGIKNLQDAGFKPQVTTVIHSENFTELEELFQFLCSLGITFWRPINVEPIGRTCEQPEMLLTSNQFRKLLDFIQSKRYDHTCSMEVTYGCSHYLGVEMERMVRNNYFFCGAGIYVASIRSNGDTCACLDIENLPSLVQGNIRSNEFWDIWCNKFHAFRTDKTKNSFICSTCEDRYICGGDSAYTWDWSINEPMLCIKQIHK